MVRAQAASDKWRRSVPPLTLFGRLHRLFRCPYFWKSPRQTSFEWCHSTSLWLILVIVIATPEISYLQWIDMNIETLGASSEPGRSSSVLVFAAMCCSREDTHGTSQWMALLRFFFIKGFAAVILYDCLRQSLSYMFLWRRHYGKCKNETSEFMKLVLCVCVHVLVCMYTCARICCVPVCPKASGGQRLTLGVSPVALTLIFWDKVSLNLELAHSVRLAAS